MRCSNCGSDQPRSAKYCEVCGAPLVRTGPSQRELSPETTARANDDRNFDPEWRDEFDPPPPQPDTTWADEFAPVAAPSSDAPPVDEWSSVFDTPNQRPPSPVAPASPPRVGSGTSTRMRSKPNYTVGALVAAFLYLAFWFPGAILNIVFLKQVRAIERTTGKPEPGKGCLYVVAFFGIGVPALLILGAILQSL